MAKYSNEFKLKVVREYLNGKIGIKMISRKYGLPSTIIVRNWIKAYEKLGEEGLKRSRRKNEYSFQFKLDMVELYESTELTYADIALDNGINNPSIIARWVSIYRAVGSEGLLPQTKGRPSTVKKGKSNSTKTSQQVSMDISTDESARKLKELERENLKLRIENAYLKEFRRLCMEEDHPQKKSQELSTVSEKNSN